MNVAAAVDDNMRSPSPSSSPSSVSTSTITVAVAVALSLLRPIRYCSCCDSYYRYETFAYRIFCLSHNECFQMQCTAMQCHYSTIYHTVSESYS
mmetsp:Transcript_29012/g.32544  ORF Transcript_29012/g.32544 Transcript_29012/m.32544 type:complete len:94 (+) Transcript_29012:81-362(+)